MDNKQRLVNDANSNPYTDPLVRTVSSQPTVQLPNSTPNPTPNPAGQFHSHNINPSNATSTNTPVKATESPSRKPRRFFRLKSKQKDTVQPHISTPNAPSTQSTPPAQATPANPTVVIPTISKQASPDKATEKSNSTTKSTSFIHTLFAGKHKAITVPIIIFIVAETSLLILFLTGTISLKPVTDESITTTTNDEATDLYNDVTNENSTEDTLNYWNSQISMYETRKDYLEAYNLRIKAADFYIDREDNATAFTILRNTKMGDAIGLPERFTLYSLIITLANNQGYYDIAKAYQDAIPTLNSTTIFDGSATAKYNQLKELSIPTNDAAAEEEDDTLKSNGDMSADNVNSSNLEEQSEPTEPIDDDSNAEESVEWE